MALVVLVVLLDPVIAAGIAVVQQCDDPRPQVSALGGDQQPVDNSYGRADRQQRQRPTGQRHQPIPKPSANELHNTAPSHQPCAVLSLPA